MTALRDRLPHVYTELETTCAELERRRGDVLDIEFTVERGILYMLQVRSAKRTAQAAIRIAADLLAEQVVTTSGALSALTLDQIRQVQRPGFDPDAYARARGRTAPGHRRRSCSRARGRRALLRLRRRAAGGQGRQDGHPGASGDQPDGSARHDRRSRHPHRHWWFDQSRRRGGPCAGDHVRRRMRGVGYRSHSGHHAGGGPDPDHRRRRLPRWIVG